MIKLLFCILFGILVSSLAHAELIDSNTIFKVQDYPQPVNYLISAFGPRDPQGTGSRFHQGIDLLIPEGQLISAQQPGTISAINNYGSKKGGKNIIVNFNDGTFTFQHIFANGNEPINKSGMTFYPSLKIKSNALVTFINGGKNTYQNCNAIFDYTDPKIRRVLVDIQCAFKIPPTITMSILTPALITGTWTVTSIVGKGMNLAVVGSSGTYNKPHLHVNYFVKELRNPLFLLKHGVNQISPSLPFHPEYKSSFVSNPQLGSVLDTPTFQSSDLPKKVWVQVDFSKGYDLEKVDFVFDQNNPSISINKRLVDTQYALGGIPDRKSFPSSIAPHLCNATDKSKCTIQVGSNITNTQSSIYAKPTLLADGYRKSLSFNVQLPTGLIAGDHILTVNTTSVNGITQSQDLPFKIDAPLTIWNAEMIITKCDEIRAYTEYDCPGGASDYDGLLKNKFSIENHPQSDTTSIRYARYNPQAGIGVYYSCERLFVFGQKTTDFEIKNYHSSGGFYIDYSDPLKNIYHVAIQTPTVEELSPVLFKITNRTSTHMEGTFSRTINYYRYKNEPNAVEYNHLEIAIGHFSGTWSSELSVVDPNSPPYPPCLIF